MNISIENINNVNAVIKVLIEKQDYENSVEKKLKEFRQQSSIPGFRPGKAPAGLIRKRIGKSVLVEEINRILSETLTTYIKDKNLQILGEPLSNTGQQKEIDWDNDESFEFAFDVGLAPEIEIQLSKEDKLNYYIIAVTEDLIDQQVEMFQSQYGQNIDVDEVTEKSLVRGNFTELNENGNPKENGIKTEGVLLSVDLIKNEEIKKNFIGRQKDEILTFNPVTAYEDRHEVGHLLKIKHEEADELNSLFNFAITEISDFQKAELNEELFGKIYGEDSDIKTETDLREKLKEEISESFKQTSDNLFARDAVNTLIEKVNPELPEEFLKRWLKVTGKDLTEEQVEQDFEGFKEDLSWQLIKNHLIKENKFKAEFEEVKKLAKNVALAQYRQYGIYTVPDENLENFVNVILEKPGEIEKLTSKILEDMVLELVKTKVTLEEKEVSREEFNELVNS